MKFKLIGCLICMPVLCTLSLRNTALGKHSNLTQSPGPREKKPKKQKNFLGNVLLTSL